MAKGKSMIIEAFKVDKTTAKLTLSGRLDTINAPMLERKIKQWGDEITELVLDFAELEYISSMGLRILLQAYKTMKEKNEKMVIINMQDSVREVFEMTGFLKLMVEEEKFVVIRKNQPGCIELSFNGEMLPENVSMVKAELSEIKNQMSEEQVKIILDMENLKFTLPEAIKLLSDVINETEWKGRELYIHNVSNDLRNDFIKEKIGSLLVN